MIFPSIAFYYGNNYILSDGMIPRLYVVIILTLQIGAYLSGNHESQECTPIVSEVVPLTKPFTEVGDSDKVNNYGSTSNIDDNEHSTPNINEWVEFEDEMSDSIPEMDSIDDNLFMKAPYQDDHDII